MEMKLTAREKITKARVKLQKKNPFFSYLAMSLNIIEDKKTSNTCGVDCKGNLYFNPDWIDKLNLEETQTLITHEVLHVAFLHLIRKGEREHEIWNIATDLIANNLLSLNGFVFSGVLKKGVVPRNNTFKEHGLNIVDIDKKSSEEIYSILKNKLKEKIKEDCNGFDEHILAEENEEEKDSGGKGTGKSLSNEAERIWKGRIAEAVVFAKQQGNAPAGMDRLIDEILQTKMNWKQILHKYICDSIPFDYSYSRPSRRSSSMDIFQPRMKKEALDVVAFVDVSGSINQTELNDFNAELMGIGRSFDNVNINLISWDTQANRRYQLNKSDIADLQNIKLCGGGGTDFTKIYEYLENENINPRIIVFFTDGYAEFPKDERYKTIWVLTTNSCEKKHIPFGEVVKL